MAQTLAEARRKLLRVECVTKWVARGFVLVCFVLGLVLLVADDPSVAWQKLWWRVEQIRLKRVMGVAFVGLAISQGLVQLAIVGMQICFPVKARRGSRVPQLAIGIVEYLGFLTIFATVEERGDALTAIGAWIGLKTLGNWKAWSANDNGRRRLYAFMIANALQVAFGATTAHVLCRWALAPK